MTHIGDQDFIIKIDTSLIKKILNRFFQFVNTGLFFCRNGNHRFSGLRLQKLLADHGFQIRLI